MIGTAKCGKRDSPRNTAKICWCSSPWLLGYTRCWQKHQLLRKASREYPSNGCSGPHGALAWCLAMVASACAALVSSRVVLRRLRMLKRSSRARGRGAGTASRRPAIAHVARRRVWSIISLVVYMVCTYLLPPLPHPDRSHTCGCCFKKGILLPIYLRLRTR